MDFKEIRNTKHYLYDNKEEFTVSNPNVPVRHNWRHGEEGEWVLTDDDFVCQILRKSTLKSNSGKRKPYVRTVCGTFLVERLNRDMLGDTGIPENIYSMSGTNDGQKSFNERGRNSKEILFARYIADHIVRNKPVDIMDAYKMAYPDAKSEDYIKRKADNLFKTETIQKMISKEKRMLLDENGVTDGGLIERYKTIADLAENDTHKLKALDSLAKMSGLFDNEEKKSEELTIWAGFSPEQLEGVKKHGEPELIAHAKRNEKEEAR